ncbi:MAG: HlyD family efflux transporter periplasmic adaptor subunit [Pseudomonadota bacterium]
MTGSEPGERPTLFRPRVLRQRLPKRFGPVASGVSPSLQLYVVLGVLFLALVLLYLSVARFKTTVSASGVLVPGDGAVRAGPSWQGVYQTVLVEEGQSVKAGDLLALVSTRRHDRDGRARNESEQQHRQARIGQLRRELRLADESEALQVRQIEQHRRGLYESLELLRAEKQLLRQRVSASGVSLRAHETLKERGLLSDVAFHRQEVEHLALRQQIQQLSARMAEISRELEAASGEVDQVRLQQELRRHELQGQIGQLQHEASLLSSDALLAVLAKTDGTAGPVSASAGDVATPGSTLTTLVAPDVPLKARVYLPGSAMGLIRAGQSVQLTYDAYPYQSYGNHTGEVARVSATTIDPREQRVLLPEVREPVYQATVTLPRQNVVADGRSYPLRSGMRLRAEVVTAERTLLAHMFDPLLKLLRKQELP